MYVPRTFKEEYSPFHQGLPFLFVHAPKCGGSFVNAAFHRHSKNCITLNTPCLSGHLTWVDYKDRLHIIGKNIASYKTFSVIRNPFAWHVSWFTYIRSKANKRSGYYIEHEMFQKMSFPDYVDWLTDPDATKSPQFDMGKQISDWVLDENGSIAVDHILRQETLFKDLISLAEKYNLRLRIPKKPVNASNNLTPYQNYYTAKEIDIISARHKHDIKLFNYSFEA